MYTIEKAFTHAFVDVYLRIQRITFTQKIFGKKCDSSYNHTTHGYENLMLNNNDHLAIRFNYRIF